MNILLVVALHCKVSDVDRLCTQHSADNARVKTRRWQSMALIVMEQNLQDQDGFKGAPRPVRYQF